MCDCWRWLWVASQFEALEAGLKRLKLRRIREILQCDILRERLGQFNDPVRLVEYLVQEEVSARDVTLKEANLHKAKFPSLKTIDDFDFALQPTVDETRIRKLANLDFVRSAENILFLGPSGIGKSHLAVALGYEAIKAGYKVRFVTAQNLTSQLYASLADGTFERELKRFGKYHLLIIDELGFLSLDKTASNHFFQVINQAYERQSVIITSNRPFQEWAGVFYDAVIVTAILDRVLHHAHLLNMKGDSYRLRAHLQNEERKVIPLS